MRLFWKFIQHYLSPYWYWYLLGAMAVIATQGFVAAIIELQKKAIDAVGNSQAVPDTIIPYALGMITIAFVLFMVRASSRLLFFIPCRNVELSLRNDYFANLLRLDRDFYRCQDSGDLVSRCSNDIQSLRAAIGYGLMQIIQVSITLFLGISGMARMDSQAALYLLIPVILGFTIIQAHVRYVFQDWRKSNSEMGEVSALCLASFRSIALIQFYHAEPGIEQRFEQANQRYFATHLRVSRLFAFISPLVRLIGEAAVLVMLWILGPKVIAGSMTLGQLTGFLGYIAMIMPPMMSLGWTVNIFQRAIPSLERIVPILEAQPMHTGTPTQTAMSNLPAQTAMSQIAPVVSSVPPARSCSAAPLQATLEAKNLAFAYSNNGNGFQLQKVNFHLKPGQVLGIVGKIGAGKTTLVDTILRLNFIPPDCLWLNGQDVTQFSLTHYRQYFSWAGQQPFLFSMSLRDNLGIGIPPEQVPDTHRSSDARQKADDPQAADAHCPSEQKLLEVLQLAAYDLDHKLFPQGLDTMVGEKGVMLSGGQRQRIALARCLLKPAAIYILDDILAAVDYQTEQKIIANLMAWKNMKTFIIISHRISAVSWADQILLLDQGNVSDQGTHAELLERSQDYRQVYQHQSEVKP